MKIRSDPSTKPYYRCLSCHRFRKICGGRPTRDMDLQNWCEYMRDVKELAHLTNAQIAKEADVSLKTIERIMAIDIDQDIMRSIARKVELVVIGPVTRHICDLDLESISAAEKIAKLEAELASAKEEAAFWRKENDRKAKIIDKYLD